MKSLRLRDRAEAFLFFDCRVVQLFDAGGEKVSLRERVE